MRLRPRGSMIWLGAMLLLLLLGLSGCARSEMPQTVFDPKGPVAREQLKLLNQTLYMAIGVFVVVSAVFLYVLVRFRARPGEKGNPPQIHGSKTLEIIWTIIPIALVVAIGIPTGITTFSLARVPEGAMHIQVVGNQWWWGFDYKDYGFVTANEMHIPVGRPVRITLESKDVIHSFWVPKLAGKVDVVPNRVNVMWIQADEPGYYYGQCAEFCGESHALMRFRVVAEPQDKFDAWVKSHQSPPRPELSAVAARGEQLFQQGKVCYTCHAIAGTRASGSVGPDLTLFGLRSTLAAGIAENTDENLAAWLRNPQAMKPGARMPNLNLKDDEIEALVAYLRSQR